MFEELDVSALRRRLLERARNEGISENDIAAITGFDPRSAQKLRRLQSMLKKRKDADLRRLQDKSTHADLLAIFRDALRTGLLDERGARKLLVRFPMVVSALFPNAEKTPIEIDES